MTGELIIHVLHGGRTACGKKGEPGEWPPNEKWVDQDEWGLLVVSPFNRSNLCPGCVGIMEARKAVGPREPAIPGLATRRLVKFGSRQCRKCNKRLETEANPDYWHDLCDEHREVLADKIREWLTNPQER